MPRYEILSEDAMEVLDRGWRRIVSELGIEFLLPEAVEILRARRADRRGREPRPLRSRVHPRAGRQGAARVRARRRATRRDNVHIGGDHMVFAPVYGCPFIREGDVRRDAKMADFENLVRLAQSFDELDSPGRHDLRARGPAARLAPPRHGVRAADADRQALHGLGDLGPNAADTIAMGEILFGGREAIERDAGRRSR